MKKKVIVIVLISFIIIAIGLGIYIVNIAQKSKSTVFFKGAGSGSYNQEAIEKAYHENAIEFNNIESAEKAVGIKVRIPKNTFGGKLKVIYSMKNTREKEICINYENGLFITASYWDPEEHLSPELGIDSYEKLIDDSLKQDREAREEGLARSTTAPFKININGMVGEAIEPGYNDRGGTKDPYDGFVMWLDKSTSIEYTVYKNKKVSDLLKVAESMYE